MKWWEAVHFTRKELELAKILHYPACWDTAVYPTLHSALIETLKSQFRCECQSPSIESLADEYGVGD